PVISTSRFALRSAVKRPRFATDLRPEVSALRAALDVPREPGQWRDRNLGLVCAALTHSAQWSAQTKAQTKLSRTSARLLKGRGGGANHRANQSLLGTPPPAKGEGRTGLLWSNMLRCCSPTSAQVGASSQAKSF